MNKSKPKKNISLILHDVKPLPQEESQPSHQPSSRLKRITLISFALLFSVSAILGLYAFNLKIGVSNSHPQAANFGNISDLFSRLKILIGSTYGIKSDLEELKSRGLALLFNGSGEELIKILKKLQTDLANLEQFGGSLGGEELKLADEGLGGLINFLEQPGEHHLVVLFQNPSEIRPAGGFAGSYGDLIFENGSIKEIKVNDIYYPDRFLEKKIIPPIQLQGVTPHWGARDAGWFFNFPTSAEKTIELLEVSDVYAKNGTHFEGLIGLNVRVVEDILAITGPINIPEYGLVLTKDNFLEEVQKEVEAGRDKKPGENPKKILSIITPRLLEKVNQLDENGKNQLLVTLLYRMANKDIQFYFKDNKLEQVTERLGIGGTVFGSSSDYIGDYLAVVNANVAGGKTDLKIKENIELESVVDASGQVNDKLIITRNHFGQTAKESWYRITNQDFIKIFTLPQAEFKSVSGATPKEIKPLINYSGSNYSEDPILASLEKTRVIIGNFEVESYFESGKKVFATWFNVEPGKSRALEFNYKSGSLPLVSGTKYRFVFEKQSGVESNFEYKISAPQGFHWSESKNSIFEYKTDTIPVRLVIELTLLKNE